VIENRELVIENTLIIILKYSAILGVCSIIVDQILHTNDLSGHFYD